MNEYNHEHENEIVPFAVTTFRNENRAFGIKTDDRRRHVYLLGKTGMGKTTMLENFVLHDIYSGHGVAYVDPHGDTAEKLIDFIPSHRINDVIYFNPADMDYPVGFNVLESVDEAHKPLVAAGLMGVFKKIWPDVWSARMEHILNNCILALLDCPGSTLLGINRLLVDTEYRRRVLAKIKDPIVRAFWIEEYAKWEMKFRTEAIQPIQNKVGQFLSSSLIRNIVAQVKSSFDVRKIMDDRKILIINLAKGRIGEDNSRLLGGMMITKLQLAAMERVDIPELERKDFYLYVDEFQNFATQSFANILSEARKYRLNLIIAHQYIEQLEPDYVRPAVFGNVGTIICFRIGAKDAEFLEPEFTPRFMAPDLVNLAKYDIYLKLMIDGVTSEPFSARGLAPISQRQNSAERVTRVTRERYAEPRAVIEEKVNRWSQFEELTPEKLAELPLEAGPQKKAKPMHEYTCTRCGKTIKLPVKLDASRPIYCEDCLPIVRGQKPASEGPPPVPSKKPESKPPVPPSPSNTPSPSRPLGARPFGPRPPSPSRQPDAGRPQRRERDRKSFADRKPSFHHHENVAPAAPQPPKEISLSELTQKSQSETKQKKPPPASPGAGSLSPGEVASFD